MQSHALLCKFFSDAVSIVLFYISEIQLKLFCDTKKKIGSISGHEETEELDV
jgi:hypothetical protein